MCVVGLILMLLSLCVLSGAQTTGSSSSTTTGSKATTGGDASTTGTTEHAPIGDDTSTTASTEHAPTPSAGEAISHMPAVDYVWLGALFVGMFFIGWTVLWGLVKRMMPSDAGKFGCTTWWAGFAVLLTFVFFPHILAATLPSWVVWTVVLVIAVILLFLGFKVASSSGWTASLLGLAVLACFTAWWLFDSHGSQTSEAGSATTGDSKAASSAQKVDTAKAKGATTGSTAGDTGSDGL